MKYAITSMGDTAGSRVDVHFARCSYFALFDSDDTSLEFVKNPFKDVPEKAGQSAVKFLKEMGADVVISCEFGEKVKNHFNSMNMGMVIPDSDRTRIKEITELLVKKHNLK